MKGGWLTLPHAHTACHLYTPQHLRIRACLLNSSCFLPSTPPTALHHALHYLPAYTHHSLSITSHSLPACRHHTTHTPHASRTLHAPLPACALFRTVPAYRFRASLPPLQRALYPAASLYAHHHPLHAPSLTTTHYTPHHSIYHHTTPAPPTYLGMPSRYTLPHTHYTLPAKRKGRKPFSVNDEK